MPFFFFFFCFLWDFHSEECPEIPGLCIIPGIVTEIGRSHLSVPHIGKGNLFRSFCLQLGET